MRIWMKRCAAIILVAVMMCGVAGCGGSEEAAAPKREFYYVPSYQDLDMKIDYVNTAAAVDDKLFFFGSKWDEETGVVTQYMYRYDFASGEMKEFPMELSENSSIQGMTANQNGNFYAVINTYEMVGADPAVSGEDSVSEDAVAEGEEAALEDGADTEQEAEDAGADISDDSSASTATVEVETVDIEEVATEKVAVTFGEEEPVYEEEFPEYRNYMELWEISSENGSVLSKTDLTGAIEDINNFWVQYMTMDGQGNLYLSDGNTMIYVLDGQGNKLFTVTVDNWVENLFTAGDGIVYLKSWGEMGQKIRPVDVQTKKVGDAVASQALSSRNYAYNQKFFVGEDEKLLVSDSSGLFYYDMQNDTAEDILAWLDADINSDNIAEAGVLSDGRYWVLMNEYHDTGTEYSMATLTKTPASEVVVKEELVYATMWLDQSVRNNIIDFNKTNEKYRITVKEYGTDDYQTALTQFNNDLTGGNCPDLINIGNIEFSKYASKGVFEDLYAYMEKDGIVKSDYLENVFKAYEVDGKLYGIIPQFYVNTMAAKTSKVGTEPGWTLSELLDFAESNKPENLFPYGSRDSVFYYCIYNNIDDFINWETGECQFNGEEFIRTLEFAKQFPEEPNYNDEEGTSAKLRSDKVLLMQTSVSSVQEYQMMNGLFGEEVTFIGYPNSESKGNLIQPTSGSVAISAKSKHKDGAWEFVKELLSEEYQDSLVEGFGSWGFPIKKSALDKQFEEDMTPEYYENENGERVESPKTSWGYDDFNMEIYAASQEEVDAVRAIITSAERTSTSINEELTNIINEETAAFFKGQKSAKDTADIIQNRVQIYVNENR